MEGTISVYLYDGQGLLIRGAENLALARLEMELLPPGAMERGPNARREALRAFMRTRDIKPTPWARKAKVSEGALRHFLTGDTDSLNSTTLEKLAAAANATVAEILGEADPKVPQQPATIVPWLDVKEEVDGRVVIQQSSKQPGMRMSKDWVEDNLDGDAKRGRMLKIEGEAPTKELRTGDVVCVDLMRVVPARDPGLYCIWDGHAITVRRIQPIPGKPLFRMLESDAYPMIEVEQDRLQIIGRVIWRSGDI